MSISIVMDIQSHRFIMLILTQSPSFHLCFFIPMTVSLSFNAKMLANNYADPWQVTQSMSF